MSKDNIQYRHDRRTFVFEVLPALVVGTVLFPKDILGSLSQPAGSLETPLSTGYMTRLTRSYRNASELIEQTGNIIPDLPIKHPQARRDPFCQAAFFPPIMDEILLKAMEIDCRRVYQDGKNTKDDQALYDDLVQTAYTAKQRASEDFMKDPFLGLKFETVFHPDNIIDRWQGSEARPFSTLNPEGFDGDVMNKVASRFTRAYPLPFPIVEGPTLNGAGTDVFGTIYIDQNRLTQDEAVYAFSLSQEWPHALDVLTNWKLMKYLDKARLPGLYKQRIKAFNLDEIASQVKEPFSPESLSIQEFHMFNLLRENNGPFPLNKLKEAILDYPADVFSAMLWDQDMPFGIGDPYSLRSFLVGCFGEDPLLEMPIDKFIDGTWQNYAPSSMGRRFLSDVIDGHEQEIFGYYDTELKLNSITPYGVAAHVVTRAAKGIVSGDFQGELPVHVLRRLYWGLQNSLAESFAMNGSAIMFTELYGSETAKRNIGRLSRNNPNIAYLKAIVSELRRHQIPLRGRIFDFSS